MRARPIVLSLLLCAVLSPLACSSGGGSSSPGPVTGGMKPCNTYPPLFDVWSAIFNPGGHNDMSVSVDTVDAARAAEFRLTVACQSVMLGSPTISGMSCTFPPPANPAGDGDPECPRLDISATGLGGLSQVRCLFEIVPTQPLGIGNGLCADQSENGTATYRLSVAVGGVKLKLSEAADDCSAAESCLATYFNINVTPQAATFTPTATPNATPTPTA